MLSKKDKLKIAALNASVELNKDQLRATTESVLISAWLFYEGFLVSDSVSHSLGIEVGKVAGSSVRGWPPKV